jgi:23S rRNA G2069 N7-methylase RlmK/C1962 C5-methylase RlmI
MMEKSASLYNSIMNLERELKEVHEQKREYIKQNAIEAYRLCMPGEISMPVSIDIYGKVAVVNVFAYATEEDCKGLSTVLEQKMKVTDVYFIDRSRMNLRLPLLPAKEIVVREGGHKFIIKLGQYQDCGLFLDHRHTRQLVADWCKGKIFLNLFAYTGSFSVYAAAAKAKKTYSVDISRTYCNWLKENLWRNKLPDTQNWIYKMDSLEFLSYAKRKGMMFDVIVIDPPTFSRDKEAGPFSVQKDHVALLDNACAVLNQDGIILFSNNFTEFKLDASIYAKNNVRDITLETIPYDFVWGLDLGNPPIHNCFLIQKKV